MSHGFQFSRGLSTRITFKYRQVRLTTSPNPAVSLHPTHSDALSNASPLRASTYAGDDEVQSTRRRTRTTYELSEEDFSTRPKKKSRVALGQKGDSTSEIAYSSLQNRSLSPPIGQQTSSQELAPSLALSDTDLPSIRVLSEEKGVSSADASHSPPHDGLSTTNNSPTQSPSRSRTPTIESLRNQGLGTIESPWVVEDLGSPKAFDSIALNMQDIANNALNTSPAITEVMEAVSPNNEEISLSEFGGALLGRFGIQPERSLSCLPRAEALGLLDRIYVHLQNHSPGSEQYLQILRLLQECSLHCRALPTSFVVGGLNFDRQDIMGQGSEVTVYRGQLASQGVVVREIRMISGYDQEPARPKITQVIVFTYLTEQ
ncbi:hypothetical protein DL93DRAFT_572461 [Clavulina sp. PMI_390]|nr:hypothetical protein DL93DRAFT_572461 [Clavulina sp. PMI_390]